MKSDSFDFLPRCYWPTCAAQWSSVSDNSSACISVCSKRRPAADRQTEERAFGQRWMTTTLISDVHYALYRRSLSTAVRTPSLITAVVLTSTAPGGHRGDRSRCSSLEEERACAAVKYWSTEQSVVRNAPDDRSWPLRVGSTVMFCWKVVGATITEKNYEICAPMLWYCHGGWATNAHWFSRSNGLVLPSKNMAKILDETRTVSWNFVHCAAFYSVLNKKC